MNFDHKPHRGDKLQPLDEISGYKDVYKRQDYEECREKIADVEIPNCINPEEFEKLGSYLGIC